MDGTSSSSNRKLLGEMVPEAGRQMDTPKVQTCDVLNEKRNDCGSTTENHDACIDYGGFHVESSAMGPVTEVQDKFLKTLNCASCGLGVGSLCHSTCCSLEAFAQKLVERIVIKAIRDYRGECVGDIDRAFMDGQLKENSTIGPESDGSRGLKTEADDGQSNTPSDHRTASLEVVQLGHPHTLDDIDRTIGHRQRHSENAVMSKDKSLNNNENHCKVDIDKSQDVVPDASGEVPKQESGDIVTTDHTKSQSTSKKLPDQAKCVIIDHNVEETDTDIVKGPTRLPAKSSSPTNASDVLNQGRDLAPQEKGGSISSSSTSLGGTDSDSPPEKIHAIWVPEATVEYIKVTLDGISACQDKHSSASDTGTHTECPIQVAQDRQINKELGACKTSDDSDIAHPPVPLVKPEDLFDKDLSVDIPDVGERECGESDNVLGDISGILHKGPPPESEDDATMPKVTMSKVNSTVRREACCFLYLFSVFLITRLLRAFRATLCQM